MNPKNVRALLVALERLAQAHGIGIDHELTVSTSFDDGVESVRWVLAIQTWVDSRKALAFWDAIGELPEYNALPELSIVVGWTKE